jgi:UDP-glucose 4-epimerase
MAVLVTGGTGFIGSHTCIELLNAGEEIVVADNFSNSKPEVLNRLKKITGKDIPFKKVDLCDEAETEKLFKEYKIDEVIHFAGYKAVGESVAEPLMYYENNLGSTFNIIKMMKKYGCKRIVFSSSATVYGIPETVPIKEDFPISAINPYGRTKLFMPGVSREDVVARETDSLLQRAYSGSVGLLVSAMVQRKDLTQADIDELYAILKEAEENVQ